MFYNFVTRIQSFLPNNQPVASKTEPQEEGVCCSFSDDLWCEIFLKYGDPLTFACVSKRLHGICQLVDPMPRLPEEIQKYLRATFSEEQLKNTAFVYKMAYNRLEEETKHFDRGRCFDRADVATYHAADRAFEAMSFWAFYSIASGDNHWSHPDGPPYCFNAANNIRASNALDSCVNNSTLSVGKKALISRLPEEIGIFTKLTDLCLEHQIFHTLPTSITQLQSLNCLVINHCYSLTSLPESLGNLQALRKFFSFGTSIAHIPDSIGALSALKMLRITRSAIKTLPVSIGKLESLTCLSITENSFFESLPDTASQLTALASLGLASNPSMTAIPPTLTHNMRNLDMLALNDLGITEIPASIFRHTRVLRNLDVIGNPNLSCLPCTIVDLPRLEKLTLRGNPKLTSIPDNIGLLPNLRSLDFSGNPNISQLPHTINRLQAELILPAHIDPYHPLLIDYAYKKTFK